MLKNYLSYFIILWLLFQLLVEVNGQMKFIKPPSRRLHTTTLIGKRLYVLGGAGDDANTGKQLFFYDFTNSFNAEELLWQDLTSSNTVPSHDAAESVNGGVNNNTLFLYSGNIADVTSPLVYTLDTRTNLWSNPEIKGTNIERKNQLLGIVDYKGKMYLFGGWFTNGTDNYLNYVNDMLILDTVNLIWGQGSTTNAPTPRRNYGATLLPDGKIIYIGGIYVDHLPLNEVFLYDTINDSWSKNITGGMIPSNRDSFSAVLGLDGQKVIIFGGFNITPNETLYVLDLEFFNWTIPNITGKLPVSRYWHKANVIGKYMVITFGAGYDGSNDSDLLLLDISNNNEYIWKDIFDPSMPALQPPPARTSSNSPSQPNKPNNNLAIIGTVVGCLIGVIFLSIGGFLLYKRIANKKLDQIPGTENEVIIENFETNHNPVTK